MVELAQSGKYNNLNDEPKFAWWAPHVLKKRTRLIKNAVSMYKRRGYKFGMKIPISVEDALYLDNLSDNKLWEESLLKEMKGVQVAFDIRDRNSRIPPGYSPVDLMMIVDVKLDFTRNTRLVTRGDMTDPHETLTYSSVVSRESVRIAFLIAALNNIEITMFDIGNAYLNATTTEKLYTYTGPEFGEDKGKLCIIA